MLVASLEDGAAGRARLRNAQYERECTDEISMVLSAAILLLFEEWCARTTITRSRRVIGRTNPLPGHQSPALGLRLSPRQRSPILLN